MSGKQVVGDPSHDDGGGGKKAAAMKLEREVKLGDIIWVKLQGKSWWPAQVYKYSVCWFLSGIVLEQQIVYDSNYL